ncbi:hypothetical protein UVI_02033680 [Ustilaginoidea virens]|uniref:MYST-type HAT domain-containing protein n=1 Tax=Ustilaginoidea virens TaxID=1159556 RepID=A0A1B5KTM0_USTVR|nr:hypothetical protein UVI_02033680 [Ustilaginoidea virens]
MPDVVIKENTRRPSDLVAPDTIYHFPLPPPHRRAQSSLVRPLGPSALPSRLGRRPAPVIVTSVLPPNSPTVVANDRGPPRADRNIDKVVLGDLCFRTWYPSYYGKEVLGDASGNNARAGVGNKDASHEPGGKPSKRDKDTQPILERLYVCPCCFKYARELVAWRGHVRVCERKGHVPGKKIYTHPRGRRKVYAAHDGKGSVPKRRRGDGGLRCTAEVIEDQGEWSIWEVDGEKNRVGCDTATWRFLPRFLIFREHGVWLTSLVDRQLFCQNLCLFAKLFLDNKSVFFDVTGFNYYLLVYTPPLKTTGSAMEPVHNGRRQVTGFFSKEKMSWDNNNLACILIFPPWQRKGLGGLLMGASYEMSRRDGILGGPEKPISDLGKKGYKRFWSGEIARWLLGLEKTASWQALPRSHIHDVQAEPQGLAEVTQELIVDVNDCSRGTWIAAEDCLMVLRDMGLVEDAGMGFGKPGTEVECDQDEEGAEEEGGLGGEGDGYGSDATLPGQKHDAASESAGTALAKPVPRVRVDKDAVRRYVSAHGISLERACDPDGFAEHYAAQGYNHNDNDKDKDMDMDKDKDNTGGGDGDMQTVQT